MIKTIDARMVAKMFLGGAKNLESKKEWINILNESKIEDMLSDIHVKGEKPNLKHVKKAYAKKHIFTMFLENKIRLILGRER